jgi:hypothetical protein
MRRIASIAIVGLLTLLPAHAEEGLMQNVPTETVDFDKPDMNATDVARKMYGREFRSVAARRVWLEDPTDGYDQLLVRLGKERNCTAGCVVAALYYDNKQWLEVWRQPANTVGLGPVDESGMKPIFDGQRLWRWSGKAYLAQPIVQTRASRVLTEGELKTTIAALGQEFKEVRQSLEPADVLAVDIDLKDGNEAAMLVSSQYYCGNSACPIVFLDGSKVPLGVLYAFGPDFAVTDARDGHNRRLVEVSVAGGVATYSIGEREPRSRIGPMAITIAGTKR